jgi:membrane-associated protein
MISETMMQLIDQYGYFMFFVAFSLGPFGIPVPNEITILTVVFEQQRKLYPLYVVDKQE